MAAARLDSIPVPRLDVRLHGGRAVGYPLGDAFLVGAAAGCDLRLPDGALPPVVCQFQRSDDSFHVRRVAATPLSHNGQPVTAIEAFEMRDGDRLAVGAVEITLVNSTATHLTPKLVPLETDDLEVRRAALEEQARELEEDRRLWYARRQEMEAEWERLKQSPPAGLDSERALKEDLLRLDRWRGSLEERQAGLDARDAEIDERVRQLHRDAADLEEQLQLAHAEEERLNRERERLERLKADVETQSAKFAERSAQVEAQQAMLAVLRAKLDRQEEEQRRDRDRLAAERVQQEEVRRDLDVRFRDADLLRAELGFFQDENESQRLAVAEQQSRVAGTLEEFRRQKEAVQAAEAALAARERELDERAAETAEQAATLKAKLLLSLELQERLEADRIAVREREAAFAEAEAARQALQEQLRKRADDLGGRGKNLDLTSRELAEERARIEALRCGIDEWRTKAETEIALLRNEAESRAVEVERQSAELGEREAALNRQVARMKEVGAAIAAERKALFEAKQASETVKHDSEAFASRVAEQVAELRRQAPEVEQRAGAALEKLAAAREVLRGHLSELHEFARQSRISLQAESEALRQREQALDQARAEHRVAVSEFRQQLLGWQAKVGELKQSMGHQDSGVLERQRDLDALAKRLEASEQNLKRRTAEVEEEQRLAQEKRNEMERHLADMREWYRNKLRDLAAGRPIDDADMPAWEAPAVLSSHPQSAILNPQSDVDPADQQLGDLLRSRGLVDDTALQALWNEARRQRRSLRQTLLASGVVTLYQLALIEAGNLDGLALGRFRVIDRIRATPRESAYRVFDPSRPAEALTLRVLGEADSRDDVHREEFRQKFAAATGLHHPNLANVFEVLDLNGRPAALVETVSGLPSTDWPALVAAPGVWLRLVTEATQALIGIHKHGLVHSRLAPESFVLAADGTLKLVGLGEPAWLGGASAAIFDPLPASDLRGLGRVAYGWSQIGAKRRVGKGKPFPAELAAVVRRLEAGAESPMGDVIALDRPFADAAELLRELDQLSFDHPCPGEAWQKLLRSIGDEPEETPLRQSA